STGLTPASSSTRRKPCSTIGWSSMIRTLVILADLHTKKYSAEYARVAIRRVPRLCAHSQISSTFASCDFYIYQMLRADRAPAQCPLRRSPRCSLCRLTLRVAKIVAKRSRRHNFRISVGDVLPTNLATAPGYIGNRFCLIFPRELVEQLSFGSHEAEEPRSRFHCACK